MNRLAQFFLRRAVLDNAQEAVESREDRKVLHQDVNEAYSKAVDASAAVRALGLPGLSAHVVIALYLIAAAIAVHDGIQIALLTR